MNQDMLIKMQSGRGFIAALDQSGGSTPKALANYGVTADMYSGDDQMFDMVHQMRSRIIANPAFTGDKILGAILFDRTMESEIADEKTGVALGTAEYLWQKKSIVPFLKVDNGLADRSDDVQLMKPIDDLADKLERASQHGVFGTKMRSVIYGTNPTGIKQIVAQQFEVAEQICMAGLVPIIEPEVDINCPNKSEAEAMLVDEIKSMLSNWPVNQKIMFKFTIPTMANLYHQLYDFEAVVRIVALSGGYGAEKACVLLSENINMPASFSRALLEGLRYQQSDEEFTAALSTAIDKIYQASV